MIKTIQIQCFCGRIIAVIINGNNNANGKAKCIFCGRNITIHFRKHKGHVPNKETLKSMKRTSKGK